MKSIEEYICNHMEIITFTQAVALMGDPYVRIKAMYSAAVQDSLISKIRARLATMALDRYTVNESTHTIVIKAMQAYVNYHHHHHHHGVNSIDMKMFINLVSKLITSPIHSIYDHETATVTKHLRMVSQLLMLLSQLDVSWCDINASKRKELLVCIASMASHSNRNTATTANNNNNKSNYKSFHSRVNKECFHILNALLKLSVPTWKDNSMDVSTGGLLETA